MKRIISTLIAFMLVGQLATAQNTAYFTFDFNGYTVEKMIKLSDNNYFGVLYFSKGKIFTKFDPTFNVIWSKYLSSPSNIDILDIEESNNGNYFALCDKADSSYLFKFSSSGNLLNTKYFTSTTINNFTPNSITRSTTGDGVLVAGGFCNTPNYLIRLDDNFNILWKNKYASTTGTCAQSRASDLVTESNKYVYSFNSLSGGINLVTVDDNGNILNCTNYNLALQSVGYPINFKKMKSGGYMATWESSVTSNGTEFIYIDSAANYARCKKYTLNSFNYLYDFEEYDTDKFMVGGTTQIGTDQSNLYFAVDQHGEILWSKTSESLVNPLSAEGIHTFAAGLDNTIFAFGGGGLDGPCGAKLDFNGDGFCNSAVQPNAIASSDSAAGASHTITKSVLNTLTEGAYSIQLVDTSFARVVKCGTLTNTPLTVSDKAASTFKLYPNPTHDYLKIECPYWANWEVAVFTILGNKVLTKTIGSSNQLQVNVADFTAGQYFILLNDGGQQHSFLITKE